MGGRAGMTPTRKDAEALADLVYPPPDELLAEAETTSDRRSVLSTWRSFKRLREQETILSERIETADDEKRVLGSLTQRVPRRHPKRDARLFCEVRVPPALEDFCRGRKRPSSAAPYRPDSAMALSSPTRPPSTRPTSAATTRPASAQVPRPTSAKSTRTATSADVSVGPSIPSTAPAKGRAHLQQQQQQQQLQPTEERVPSPVYSECFTPRSRPAPRIPNLSPLERIAGLYSPTAWIRTRNRDEKMTPIQWDRTYRNTLPPKASEPLMPTRYRGVAGADPSLSHFLSLEFFDSSEMERVNLPDLVRASPHGARALSQYYEQGKTTADGAYCWKECYVIDHDPVENSYLIRWSDGTVTKNVKRLNIIVPPYESKETWAARVAAAGKLRDAAEKQLREHLYIDEIDDHLISPIDEEQVDRILSLVAPVFPTAQLHVIERCLAEMKSMRMHACKEAVFRYKTIDVREQRRLVDMQLPPPRPFDYGTTYTDLNSLHGTIDIPSTAGKTSRARFLKNRQFIADNLFFTHRILFHTIFKLVGKWSAFQDKSLFDSQMSTVVLPCELLELRDHQAIYLDRVTERLKGEWTASVVNIITNDLVGHFSFYDDDIEKFEQGRMKRFLRVVNMIMGHQLRELVLESVKQYAAFLGQYRARMEWHEDQESFRFGAPSGRKMPSKEFLSFVGTAVDQEIHRAPPELRVAHIPQETTVERERKKTLEQQKLRMSIGCDPDDPSAPRPGTLEFIRRRASHAATHDTVDSEDSGVQSPPAPSIPPPAQASDSLQMKSKRQAKKRSARSEKSAASAVSGNVSLVKIRLNTDGAGKVIVYEPSLEEIEEVIRGILEAFFRETDDITGVGEQLFPLLQLQPFRLTASTKVLRDTDAVLISAKKLVTEVLEGNLRGPTELRDLYLDFQYILDIDVVEFVQDFVKMEPKATLADYQHLCKRLQDDMNAIAERSLNEVSFALIKVECYPIKAALIAKAKEVMHAILDQLTTTCNADIISVDQRYNEILERIRIIPESPEELQQLKQYVDKVPTLLQELSKDFDAITETVQLLSSFGCIPEQKSFETYWATYSRPRKICEELDDSGFKYKENRNRFMQQLRDNTERLTEDVSAIKKKVESLAYEDDETRMEELYLTVRNLREMLNDCADRAAQYNDHERIFGMPVTKHSIIKEVMQQFEPYETLWNITHAVAEHYEKWLNGPLLSLQAEEVEYKAMSWIKDLGRLNRQLANEAPHIIVRSLKEKLEGFKPHIPLVTALLEKGIKTRHWDQISRLIGFDPPKSRLPPTEELTLTYLLDQGLATKLGEVQQLAEGAAKEWRLEDQLERMKAEWKNKQFELRPYRDTKMLHSVDDIEQLLDDHVVKTQTILGSLDVRHIEDMVRKWEAKLLKMQQVIEEWLKCQNNWYYLEPIFSSVDIQNCMAAEATQFDRINTMWRSIMEVCAKDPRVEIRCTEDRLLQNFEESNKALESILKQLNRFLETKRVAFPRFYFLSNEDLLEILSETKDPFRIQSHLKKCFEGLSHLTFSESLDIIAMSSDEGESLPLAIIVNPSEYDNLVEKWLLRVEESMQLTIKESIARSITDYVERSRMDWMLRGGWPGQVCICVSQIYWAFEVEEAIRKGPDALKAYLAKGKGQLADMVEAVRGKLSRTQRCTLQAMTVIEVHAVDIVDKELIYHRVADTNQFVWLAQLRYYYEERKKSIITGMTTTTSTSQGGGSIPTPSPRCDVYVKQTNAQLPYGYEYLGNTGRLVITPLTDRCYRTLMGALHLSYGGAPEGPAGTGKTETTKDLAKALAKYCLVYNCSDQISHYEMAKMFRGLAACGAWACFDEFNRIEIQVLSVIAQQILTIQLAIGQNRIEFEFEGQLNALKKGCSVFITMNPGYAGRSALPDNLKALFRPVAMMVPDYAMIGEISLFSCGFKEGRDLATKIVATYRLCSEQLSSMHHYDYGMRAVKTVLNAAGRLRAEFGNLQTEKEMIYRAIYDVNYPKFVPEDLRLFELIIGDLFPEVTPPKPDYALMKDGLAATCRDLNLQPVSGFVNKALQLWEMIILRHGLMLIGGAGTGKSSALKALQGSLNWMHDTHSKETKVRVHTVNPKAITTPQLYGANDAAREWNDGVLSNLFRQAASATDPYRYWIALDGPVDAVWIENMNTVLDDNKKLCLLNGDIIHMTDRMNMIFEVGDLAVASPATVSRCGMIYFDESDVGYHALIASWYTTLPSDFMENTVAKDTLTALLNNMVEPALSFVQTATTQYLMPGLTLSDGMLVSSLLVVLRVFLSRMLPKQQLSQAQEDRDVVGWVEGVVLFSLMWSVGAVLSNEGKAAFANWLVSVARPPKKRKKDEEGEDLSTTPEVRYEFLGGLPALDHHSLLDYLFDPVQNGWVEWISTQPEFKPHEEASYHEIIVPTVDTIRISYVAEALVETRTPFLLYGPTGTGKTILIKDMLSRMEHPKDGTQPVFQSSTLQFSARTTCNQTQSLIEARLDKRKRNTIGPPQGKVCVIFVDDLSMPEREESGAQPPVELLRQWLDYGGWYEHSKGNVDFKRVEDITLAGAMQPGRNDVTQRFLRHFAIVSVPQFTTATMKKMFGVLMEWILSQEGYEPHLVGFKDNIVSASVELFTTIRDQLLPTPEKAHYVFNLRDISKVFQGMSLCHGRFIHDESDLLRLWVHENLRVYQDRLVNDTDREWFAEMLNRTMQHVTKKTFEVIRADPDRILYDDFMDPDLDKSYQPITDLEAARAKLESYRDEHDAQPPSGSPQLNIVIFEYVLRHVARISRIIKLPMGNALLIGVGGTGRQSATRLAAFMLEYRLFQITIQKSYSREAWRTDLRTCIKGAVTAQGSGSTAFLLTDGQIKDASFLEDIANLLNTGEVPQLFEEEDMVQILEVLAKIAREQGRRDLDTRERLQRLMVQRTQRDLHLVLCFSPIGSWLRSQLRMFPALVNCCSIDFFAPWPEEGLRSVAQRGLNDPVLDEVSNEEKAAIVNVFVDLHLKARESVELYYAETQQRTYVTPASFLELLTTFKRLHRKQREQATNMRDRYYRGLEQMQQTEESIGRMSEMLEIQKPQLRSMAESTAALIETIEMDEKDADITRQAVAVEEAAASEKAEEARKIKEHCESVLARAMPALELAMAQVADIDKRQLVEIRTMTNPSEKIKQVMSAVCVCLGMRPVMETDPTNPKKKRPDYWTPSKKLMADTNEFLNTLLTYKDRSEGLDPAIFETGTGAIQPFIQDKNFNPDKVRTLSKALAPVCGWVVAMEKYYQVDKRVRPKQAELQRAQAEYDVAMSHLAQKKAELERVDARLEEMRQKLRVSEAERDRLKNEYEVTETKLERARQLLFGLGDEKERYKEQGRLQQKQLDNLIGDALISACYFAYLTPLTQSYRKRMLDVCRSNIMEQGLPATPDFEFARFLSEDVQIEEWKLQHLPSDSFSIDNAIVIENTTRCPLMIDPQLQAVAWLKERWSRNNLIVLRPNQEGYIKSIAMAVRSGYPVLLENCTEEIDPELTPLLQGQVVKEPSGRLRITIGDQDVVFHKNWTEETPPAQRARLFLTTKMPRPHYKPEISSRVTLIAFMITPVGLQDQLLQKVVQFEERDLEEKKNKNLRIGAKNKAALKRLEDEILHHLSTPGSLLDNQEAVQSLQNAQRVAEDTAASQREVDRILAACDRTRKKFSEVADKSASLFFCVTELGNVDPMYQYSLQWFLAMFNKSLENSKQPDQVPVDTEERNRDISNHFFTSLYKGVCRSLFAKDRLVFSLSIACALIPEVQVEHIRFLCTGGVDKDTTLKQGPAWLPQQVWKNVTKLSTQMPTPFKSLAAEISAEQGDETIGEDGRGLTWRGWYEAEYPYKLPLPRHWETQLAWSGLTGLYRLMLVRALRIDSLVPSIGQFVSHQPSLGPRFTEHPVFALKEVFTESTSPAQPFLFVLSSGADPMMDLRKLAEDEYMDQKMHVLSLGQGMQSRAEKLIQDGKTGGWWVVLQNCHLFKDWMPTLEKIIDEYSSPARVGTLHVDYRLWLTSMPSPEVPVGVLMNASKLVLEAPKGLRQNMLGSYKGALLSSTDFFEGSRKPFVWKRLCYGLCFYHAMVQERRNYGPLGWNIPYEFSNTDLGISLKQLRAFVDDYEQVPYDALLYLTGECNYGGRVTDDRDRRCLLAMLRTIYNERVLEPGYQLDRGSTLFQVPGEGKHDHYLSAIAELPAIAPPSVFGLHANADIAKDEWESSTLLKSVLATLPQTSVEGASSEGRDPKEEMRELAESLQGKLPGLFDVDGVRQLYPVSYRESMNTVLTMELLRFNTLLSRIHKTLRDLQKALKGEIVLSPTLEDMLNDMMNGAIPRPWRGVSYPSLKPLGSYVTDLADRLQFFSTWIERGPPSVFWLGGFFFTQSFLTGVQQNYSRKNRIEIDTLLWAFEYLQTTDGPPEHGCYIDRLYLEGAGWSALRGQLTEAKPKVMHVMMPTIWLKPTQRKVNSDANGVTGMFYKIPLYKTSERRGVLSTTGHNSNYVMSFDVPIPLDGPESDPSHWVMRGAALLCQLDY